MSAAATAAGYLYASGRLRGRASKEQHPHQAERAERKERERPRETQGKTRPPREREVRVAVYEQPAEKPKRTPKIEYRVRRWRPENADG